MLLDTRVALVTGAGSGIGAASARTLAAAGARVALLGRTKENLEEVVDEIHDRGGEALPVVADVSRAEALREAVRRIEDGWGRLDVVVANAGVNGVWAPIEELDPSEFRDTVDINLTGTFLTIKYTVPLLRRAGGSVIIVSSINGTRVFSNPGATAYACSKGAQVVLGRMLALELAKHRIRVNVICPGAVESNIDESTERRDPDEAGEPEAVPDRAIPLTDDRPASSEQVADLVLFLAGDGATHITGSEVWIDGAQSLLKG